MHSLSQPQKLYPFKGTSCNRDLTAIYFDFLALLHFVLKHTRIFQWYYIINWQIQSKPLSPPLNSIPSLYSIDICTAFALDSFMLEIVLWF